MGGGPPSLLSLNVQQGGAMNPRGDFQPRPGPGNQLPDIN